MNRSSAIATAVYRVTVVLLLIPMFIVSVALIHGYFEVRDNITQFSNSISQLTNPTPAPAFNMGVDPNEFNCAEMPTVEGC